MALQMAGVCTQPRGIRWDSPGKEGGYSRKWGQDLQGKEWEGQGPLGIRETPGEGREAWNRMLAQVGKPGARSVHGAWCFPVAGRN